jgi:serine/threonine-protein kinase
LIAASLVGGLSLAVWQMRVARSERDHARLESARAQQVAAFLRSLFESSYPRRARGEKLTAQDLLDAGAARVNRELARQPDLQASMLALLGSVYLEMGFRDKAEPLLSRSLALREKLPGPEHDDVAESLLFLSHFKSGLGDYATAAELAKRAIRIREQTPGREAALAEALSQLGGILRNLGRLEEARDLLQRAVAIEEKSGGTNLYKWLTNLAAVEVDLDNFDSARKLAERALEIGIRSEGKVDVQVDVTMMNLASMATAQEDYPRALSLFERALAIDERAFGKENSGNVYTLGEMGELYLAMGDFRRAREALDRAIELGKRGLPPDHLAFAAPMTYLGRLLLAEGKPREALSFLERGLALREKAFPGQDHEAIAESLTDIALARKQLEGPAVAEPMLRKALAIRRHVLVAGHRSLVPTLTALGGVLMDLGREAEARPLLAEAVEIARAKLPERHSQRREAEEALRAAQKLPSKSAALR